MCSRYALRSLSCTRPQCVQFGVLQEAHGFTGMLRNRGRALRSVIELLPAHSAVWHQRSCVVSSDFRCQTACDGGGQLGLAILLNPTQGPLICAVQASSPTVPRFPRPLLAHLSSASKVAASCGITDKTFEFCKTHGHASVVAMAKATPPHPGRERIT